MNKKHVLESILVKYGKEDKLDKQILQDIRKTIKEMEIARSMFNSVEDEHLIEVAIYREEAAKKRFDYLFSIARDKYLKKKLEA